VAVPMRCGRSSARRAIRKQGLAASHAPWRVTSAREIAPELVMNPQTVTATDTITATAAITDTDTITATAAITDTDGHRHDHSHGRDHGHRHDHRHGHFLFKLERTRSRQRPEVRSHDCGARTATAA
jgi:hypothetical protein